MKKKRGRPKKPEVTAETPLTFREKRFIDAFFMSEPPFNGAAAARKAGFSEKSCAVQAYNLLIKYNVKAEIEKRQAEIERLSQVTREQWLKKGARFYHADMRKIVDGQGHVLDIPEWGDNEAAMIAGVKITEQFTQVETKDGKKRAEHTGYVKEFKYVDPMKAHEYFGKISGFITDDTPEDDSLKSLTLVFVNSKGERVDPKMIEQRKPPRVINPQSSDPGMKVVR